MAGHDRRSSPEGKKPRYSLGLLAHLGALSTKDLAMRPQTELAASSFRKAPSTRPSPRPRRRWRALTGLVVCALLVLSTAGCSVRKIAYGFLPRILVGRIVDTFDLDRTQKKAVQAKVAALHEWHRQNELPRYAQLLESLEQKLADGISREEMNWMLEELTAAGDRLARQVSPVAGQVLSGLRDEQIAHSEGEMKKTERERFELLDKPEQEYVDYRLKQARKNLKTWLGSFTPEQLAEWERLVRKNRLQELRRREVNQRNQRDFLAALRSRPGAPALADLVQRWTTRFEINETPAHQQDEKRAREDFIDSLIRIDQMMSPEQRRHLIAELRAWRVDFTELAAGL